MYLGCTYILHRAFDAKAVMETIKGENVTHIVMVPAQIIEIVNHPDFDPSMLTSLEMILSVGAPLQLAYKEALNEALPGRFYELYGLTEGMCTVLDRNDALRKTGSVGVPPPLFELKIIDPEGNDLPSGEVGEICVSGPQIMKGYWKRADATDKVMIGDFLRTGDVGKIDENGFTFILDRDKDLILVGGFNVFPRTIEEAINDHPSVEEVTVIGIPDDYLGETPKAFVKLKDSAQPLNEEELLAFIKPKIGKHERPSQIEFRPELPKTMVGKLSKKELVAEEKAKYEAAKEAK
ncbi:MAG: AMP-binding protein, partial [Kordiimonadaceae bacterium]|nr:AMP-binding protein [Kordiimonadaceae bacterium]